MNRVERNGVEAFSGTVVFPLSSCQGTPELYFYNCLAEIYYNYFNIAKARRERSRGKRV